MRNVRYLPPEERVLALNTTAEALGGPIGDSRFNLRGNSASRAAHTGGLFPWKNLNKERYRDIYNIPTIPTESSMHPMGTNAAMDPRGIVVPQVSTAPEFTSKAVESSKIQFGDTITGRQSDIPRRIIIDNMLEKTPPSLTIGSPMIYGVNADPADVKASKKFLQLPENERLRANIAQASFTLDSPQGQRLLRNEANKAKAALYIADSYYAGLPIPDPKSTLKIVRENPRGAAAGVAMSALNPEVAQAVEQNNLGAAGNILARDVAIGTLGEMGIKKALPLAGKYAPTLAKIGGVAGAAGTGAALFSQGQSGSLTDVITRKAAQNPIPFMPAVKANPETDIGARASRAIVNEVKYLSKQAKPLMKAIDNELQWLGKAGQRAFSNIFGKREI